MRNFGKCRGVRCHALIDILHFGTDNRNYEISEKVMSEIESINEIRTPIAIGRSIVPTLPSSRKLGGTTCDAAQETLAPPLSWAESRERRRCGAAIG
eukprot:SAG31_NODE_7105_length_1787_cov_1.252962_2_plen_97_part_00